MKSQWNRDRTRRSVAQFEARRAADSAEGVTCGEKPERQSGAWFQKQTKKKRKRKETEKKSHQRSNNLSA